MSMGMVQEVRELCAEARRDNPVKECPEHHLWRYVEMLDVLMGLGASRVLSVGIGHGIPEIYLKEHGSDTVCGTERQAHIRGWCRVVEDHGINVRACELGREAIPFENEDFDLVIFSEVLEHLRCPPLVALNEIRRVLRSGGSLFLSTPNAASIRNIAMMLKGKSVFPQVPYDFTDEQVRAGVHITDRWMHIREWTLDEITDALRKAGFSVVREWHGNSANLFRFVNFASMGSVLGWVAARVLPRLRGQIYVLARKV